MSDRSTAALRIYAGPLFNAALILLPGIPYHTVMLLLGGEISRAVP